MGGSDERGVINGHADQVHSRHAAQTRGGPTGRRRCLRHQGPDGIVSAQKAVEFLDDPNRLLAAQRMLHEARVRLNCINGPFTLPSAQVRSRAGASCRVVTQRWVSPEPGRARSVNVSTMTRTSTGSPRLRRWLSAG